MDDWAVRTRQHNVLARFDANSATSSEIASLDDRIAQAALTIRNRAAAREFFESFAADPQGHLRTWIASQARDLDALLGGDRTGSTPFSAEELKRAETFRGPWVDEAVIVAESQRLAARLAQNTGRTNE